MGLNRGDRGIIDTYNTHIYMTANYPALVSSSNMENKRQRISKGLLKMDNPKKLATHGT